MERQAAFVRLVARVSSDCVGLAPDHTAAAIDRALEAVGTFLGADRVSVFLFRDAGSHMDNTHEWIAAGVASRKQDFQNIPTASLPGWMDRLRPGEPILIPSGADPRPEPAAEKALLDVLGIRSLLAVPMMRSGLLVGFLGFDSVRADRIACGLDRDLLNLFAATLAHVFLNTQAQATLSENISGCGKAREEYERLAAAVEQAGEAIVITDAEGLIRYVNPAFTAITGYSHDEAIGQNPRLVKSGYQDDAFYKKLWETITGGRTWQGQFVNKRKDGSFFNENATISPVRNAQGAIVNYVAVKRDITENIQLETQLQHAQRMESIGRLAGGVAHDFNNRLCVILGSADLALEAMTDTHPLHGELNAIRESARSAAEITRRLLAFARRQVVSPKVLDLNETIAGMLGMLRRLIGERVALHWLPGEDIGPVLIDPAQIDQILANLCVNAADAITGEAGSIAVTTDQVILDEPQPMFGPESVEPGVYVRLSVSDTGCGMDRATLAHIFEPFFTTKDPGKGTGLGLSTIYGIVKQNHGFINVYSEPGEGSRFTVYLPRHSNGSDAVPAPQPVRTAHGKALTVLLAEDDPTVLHLAAQMLRRLGHTVLAAPLPIEALRHGEDHAGVIDLLVTDVVMPGMNGRELAERIRVRRPNMRVLFVSGYTADVIALNGVLEDGVHFIQKPFTVTDLANTIADVMSAPAPGPCGTAGTP